MNEVVLNSTRYLDDADVRAIASYLKALPANAQAAGPVASTAQLHDGEMGYTVHCGTCHLPTGLGDRGLGVTLAGSSDERRVGKERVRTRRSRRSPSPSHTHLKDPKTHCHTPRV